MVELPRNAHDLLGNIDFALITHCQRGHKDHLDAMGAKFLMENELPVLCQPRDLILLKRRGIVAISIEDGLPETSTLKIRAVPARHGHGFVGHLMGRGCGFVFETQEGFKVYVMGDSVLTSEVEQVLTTDKPDLVVINAGGARIDVGSPILMDMSEIGRVLELSPGKVIAVHLEALNHCPFTRADLRAQFHAHIQNKKLLIPEDGETILIV